MESTIRTFPAEGGEIQRVQAVTWKRWEDLDMLFPAPDPAAFDRICALYRDYLLPRCPWIFPQMILFRLPEEIEADFPCSDPRTGDLADRQLAAAAALRREVSIVGGRPRFRSERIRRFWQTLEAARAVQIVCGRLPYTKVIPAADCMGLLTEQEPGRLLVNASFFLMDPFDCASPYDRLGLPFGLCVRDGQVLLPPLYDREALLVHRDGSLQIAPFSLSQLTVEIRRKELSRYPIYTRPDRRVSPRQSGDDLVVIGTRVEAVKAGGCTVIPAGGFVIHVPEGTGIRAGDPVCYRGLEDVVFGIQAGNSILIDGVKTDSFRSRFYNIRKLVTVPYPPSLYPVSFERDRAPRIALGADASGRPMLLWVEGAGKFGHQPGTEGCGASLRELGELCEAAGMAWGVNLDGGGSAQILLDGRRTLRVSDRDRECLHERERAVPLALQIR